MRTLLGTLLVVTIALPGIALAQKEDGKKASAAKWRQASTKYELGRFDDAIKLFEEAYELHNYHDILYNLGQAHRQKKNYERALFYYRAYLRNKKDPLNEAQVRDLTAEIERLIKKQETARDRPPSDVAAPTEAETAVGAKMIAPQTYRPPNYGPWKWLTLVTGAASAIAGTVLIAVHCTNGGQSQCSTVNDTRTPGIILSATGGALLATSVVLFVFDAKSKKPSRTQAAVVPTRGGAMFTLSGSF